jgi:hypothetical protein
LRVSRVSYTGYFDCKPYAIFKTNIETLHERAGQLFDFFHVLLYPSWHDRSCQKDLWTLHFRSTDNLWNKYEKNVTQI